MASLMVFSVLPSFITEELGLSLAVIGTVEGICIATSFISKVSCGVACDLSIGRKPFILAGSILSTCSKPLFVLASGGWSLFFARFFDRLSKGVRSAPTDAFLADASTKKSYGRTYGFRQSLYVGGAVAGASAAMLIMYLSGNQYRMVFCLSTIPNLAAIIIYFLFLKNRQPTQKKSLEKNNRFVLKLNQIKKLPTSYWYTLGLISFLMLARFSEVFLVLRAKEFECPIACLPLTIVVMDVVHALVAIPCGKLADRNSPKLILMVGSFFLSITHFLLVYVNSLVAVFVCIALAGMSMGMTQGLLKAMTAGCIPEQIRGSGFALFYLVSGVFIFLGNFVAGYLSQHHGLQYAFLAGGSCALIGSLCLAIMIYKENLQTLLFPSTPL